MAEAKEQDRTRSTPDSDVPSSDNEALEDDDLESVSGGKELHQLPVPPVRPVPLPQPSPPFYPLPVEDS